MNFADCLQAAVTAGQLDPERAKLAQEEWHELVRRYEADASPVTARQLATDDVVERMTKEVQKRKHVTVRQLATLERNQARYGSGDSELLLRDIDQVENEARGIFRQTMSQLQEFLATHREKLFGGVRDRAQLNDLLRELHGEDSGNVNAKRIAEGLALQEERLIKMLNSLGGDVKILENRGVAHAHHADKIRSAGFDRWFADIHGRLKWSEIENFKTGKKFALGEKPLEADAKAFLRPIFDNITTKGWHERTPGFSMGAKALFNQRGEHRVLHFKSADDWMAYNDAFGAQNPLEAIIANLTSLSRDIALMRHFGPSPKAGLENAGQVLTKAAIMAPRNPRAATATVAEKAAGVGLQPEERVAKDVALAKFRAGLLSGESNAPHNAYLAEGSRRVRNFLRAAHLGRAVPSMLSDLPSMSMAAQAMGINRTSPVTTMLHNVMHGLDPKTMRDLGLIMESWAQSGATMARISGEIWQPEMTGRMSSAVLRLNGMSYLSNHQKIAVQMAFSSDLAGLAGKGFGDLHPNLRRFMENRGIGEVEWDLLRDSGMIYTDARGVKYMSPAWLQANSKLPEAQTDDLAIKLGGLIEDQIAYSIPEGRVRAQSAFLLGTKPGTPQGELARSFGMYKGPAVAQMINHIRRWNETEGHWITKAGFIAQLLAMQTVTGAMTIQIKEKWKGRDFRPMDKPSFWVAAFLQGGGIGILGDFLSASTARTGGGGIAEVVAGPEVGVIGDLFRMVGPNVGALATGKETHFGRDAVKFLQRNNPTSSLTVGPVPVSLAFDRIFWNQLQELVDPEAERDFAREARKQRRDYGNDYWWPQGELRPGNPLSMGTK